MVVSTEQLNGIIKKVVSEIEVYAIYLFGSRATNQVREDSDLDLAIVSDVVQDKVKLFYLAQELADIAACDVDLIDFRATNTVLQAQIITNGEVIFCSDPYRKNMLEIRVLKEYALLNEERACIIEKIKERESTYGS